jgi:NodT family efflux transporter outer membrane factor (OMF) lipoprotein
MPRSLPGSALAAAWPLCACIALGGLAGCALKNPPRSDELQRQTLANVKIPAEWSVKIKTLGPARAGWLSDFGDPDLQRLVDEALIYNADLAAAAARVERAAAYVKVAGGSLYPEVNAGAHTGGKSAGDALDVWGIKASWELDIWGRVRYGARSAEEQYAGSQADYEFARQSLAALVVKAWLIAVEAGLQRDLAAAMVRDGEQTVSLAETRQRVGQDSELEVRLASAGLQTQRDTLRQTEFSLEQSRQALELLLGRYPAAEVEVARQLPTLSQPVPAGLPSELLERRPDVIAAERRVAAAFDLVEEAKAARLPSITLTGGGNHISSDIVLLEDRNYIVWGVGANLLAPLFTGGRLKAQVEVRSAEQKEAVAGYARTAQKAFGDVENALASELALSEREPLLQQAVKENERAVELEIVRYKVGSGDMRAVLQQQMATNTARTSLLRVQSEQRVQRVNLYLALGGGFKDEANTAAVSVGQVQLSSASPGDAAGP